MKIAAIDPGAKTGIVIVALPEYTVTPSRGYDLDQARFVCAEVISTKGAASERSASQRRAPLFEKTRNLLVQHDVDEVVIERPSDIILGGFKSAKRKKAGEATGTAFGLGNHFGLVEAACIDMMVDRITCYQIRTHGSELGWMQRREKKVPAREQILRASQDIMCTLVRRPADGIIRIVENQDDENVLMALGVLAFHCDRERGRV